MRLSSAPDCADLATCSGGAGRLPLRRRRRRRRQTLQLQRRRVWPLGRFQFLPAKWTCAGEKRRRFALDWARRANGKGAEGAKRRPPERKGEARRADKRRRSRNWTSASGRRHVIELRNAHKITRSLLAVGARKAALCAPLTGKRRTWSPCVAAAAAAIWRWARVALSRRCGG